jgi:hypothetical protein
MQVLVVDDEAPVRDALRRALTLEGYSVELAADGTARLSFTPPLAGGVRMSLYVPGRRTKDWRKIKALRRQLAAAYRLVDYFGWTELIYGHLTARVPGEKPRSLGETNAPDLMWVPLFVKAPGQRQGRVNDDVVRNVKASDDTFEPLRARLSLQELQELTITGTHSGEFLGVPPTGRWTENYVAAVVTLDDDGTMIEGTLYWNPLAMMCQLGVASPPVPRLTDPSSW